MAKLNGRRRASKRKKERETRGLERINFSVLTRSEFIAAVTYIALRKVRERGALGHKLGMETEARFFTAFEEPGVNLPYWFFGVEKANAIDDARGIDAFAITDIGEIAIQVKSSFCGKLAFDEKRPEHGIMVLVVKKNFSTEKIVLRAIERISSERSRRIRRPSTKIAL